MCTTATARRRWWSTIPPSGSSRCISIRGIPGPGPPTSAVSATSSMCRAPADCRVRCMCGIFWRAWMPRSSRTTSPTGRRRCARAWGSAPSSACWRAAIGSICWPPVSWRTCAHYLEHVTVTVAPAQSPQASKNWPTSLYRRPDGTLEQDISPSRMREILHSGEGELWVDIDSTNMHQHALLEKVFEFHPLSIEDTLSPGTRVKFEEYPRYVFVVMAVIRFDEGTPEPYDLATSNLYFFLGKNVLVTVHGIPSKSCAAVRERLMRNPELMARGVEMTMHNIIDQSV